MIGGGPTSTGASWAASAGMEPPEPGAPPDEDVPPAPPAPPLEEPPLEEPPLEEPPLEEPPVEEPPLGRTAFVVPPVDEPPLVSAPPESADPPLAKAPPLFDEPPIPVGCMRARAQAPAPIASKSTLAAKTSRGQIAGKAAARPKRTEGSTRKCGMSGPRTSVIP